MPVTVAENNRARFRYDNSRLALGFSPTWDKGVETIISPETSRVRIDASDSKILGCAAAGRRVSGFFPSTERKHVTRSISPFLRLDRSSLRSPASTADILQYHAAEHGVAYCDILGEFLSYRTRIMHLTCCTCNALAMRSRTRTNTFLTSHESDETVADAEGM